MDDAAGARGMTDDDRWLTSRELAPLLGFRSIKTCRNALTSAGVPGDGGLPQRYRLAVAREMLGGDEAERKRRGREARLASICNRGSLTPWGVRDQRRPKAIRNAVGVAAYYEHLRLARGEGEPPPLVGPQPGDGWVLPVETTEEDVRAGQALWAAIVRSAA